ncbi:MAG: hypothetical protein KatS3mg024_2246 [Armatimonadota bacterium]|nr:MAG: hypothetical protein KatS3mg024_2246 [Armatimonadota bacterium]
MGTEPNALRDAISEALALGKSDPNEASTCLWIIVPLLEAAGYQRHEIQPQETDPAGRKPDYTILPDSEHTWFLEAKAWAVDLNDQHVRQALIYAYTNNRRWVVLTNGREWRLYDNSIPGELSGKLVAKARLEDVDDVEEFLAAIGRQSVTDGTIERYARDRLLRAALEQELCDPASDLVKAVWTRLRSRPGLSGITRDQVAAFFSGRPPGDETRPPMAGSFSEESTSANPPAFAGRPQDFPGGRFTLQVLLERSEHLVKNRNPGIVIFPDGRQETVSTWKDAACAVVKWVGEAKGLPPLPFSAVYDKRRYFLNTRPGHPNPKTFHRFCELSTSAGSVYMDVNRNATHLVRSIVSLCETVGVVPESIQVQVKPGWRPPVRR